MGDGRLSVPTRLLAALDRANRRHPWSHNSFYDRRILREARRARRAGATTALDIGCGTGELLVRLRGVLPEVVGLEADATTAAVAEARVAGRAGIRVVHGAFPSPAVERAGLVTLVAVLHHLPLAEGIRAARDAVAPGGRLVVVGLAEDSPPPLELVSMLLNPLIGVLRHPRAATSAPAATTAPTSAPEDSFARIREAMRAELPGVRIRQALFWRYVAVWVRPSG